MRSKPHCTKYHASAYWDISCCRQTVEIKERKWLLIQAINCKALERARAQLHSQPTRLPLSTPHISPKGHPGHAVTPPAPECHEASAVTSTWGCQVHLLETLAFKKQWHVFRSGLVSEQQSSGHFSAAFQWPFLPGSCTWALLTHRMCCVLPYRHCPWRHSYSHAHGLPFQPGQIAATSTGPSKLCQALSPSPGLILTHSWFCFRFNAADTPNHTGASQAAAEWYQDASSSRPTATLSSAEKRAGNK